MTEASLWLVDGEKIHSVKYENKILTIPYTAQTEKDRSLWKLCYS